MANLVKGLYEDFWWDMKGHLHVINLDGSKDIYMNAKIVDQQIIMGPSQGLVMETMTFVGKPYESDEADNTMDYVVDDLTNESSNEEENI